MSFLGRLFGGGGSTTVQPSQIQYGGPSAFTTTGGTGTFANNTFTLNQTPQLSSLIGNLQSTFQNQSNAFGGLAQTVRPGFSQLRRAGLNQLNTQQQASTSNLRDNLAQRRILGSSFANASLSQQDAEFAQKKANFVAQSYLQELEASNQLIQEQYGAATKSFQVGIDQSNLETDIASRLSQQSSQINAQLAQAQAYLNEQAATFNAKQASDSQTGLGRLFGTLFSAGTNSLGGSALGALFGGASSLFGGGQPTPTSADYGGPGIGSGGFNFLDAQAA